MTPERSGSSSAASAEQRKGKRMRKRIVLSGFLAVGLIGCGSELNGAGGGSDTDGTLAQAAALSGPGLDAPTGAAGAPYSRAAVVQEAPTAAADLPGSAGPAVDARAAMDSVAAFTLVGTSPLASWYTGSVAAGAQQHFYWHHSGNNVYKVGFAPSGSTPSNVCKFQVVRTWDVQLPSGERQFHFIVQNAGSISCGANVLLQSQAPSNTWAIGTVSPGATASYTWNNANPLTATHFVNVSPSGATGASNCELEVTRSYYSQLSSGERKFNFQIKNVGSLACSGTVLLSTNTNVNSSWSTGTLSPGATAAWYWNNANPRNRVYVPGLSPLGATGANTCQLELLPTSYLEQTNADETSQRRYYIGVKNVGSIACSGTLLINYLDPNNTNPLPVMLAPQQTNMWCWAASGEMVMNYLGASVTQCHQANEEFSRTDCCDTPTPMGCINGGWPEFDKYGYNATVGGALSWTDLKAQIDANETPYAFSWHWNGGGGHMMVVTGYKVIAGQNYVTINDPWSPNVGDQRDILYSEYVSGSGYTHWRDYYDVSKK